MNGTVNVLEHSLDQFFGDATGVYIAVLPEDSDRVQKNGEHLLADQFRLPLEGVQMPKCATEDGDLIYEAYVNRNLFVRAFLKVDQSNKVLAAALADSLDIKKGHRVIGVRPRITIFYKSSLPPSDLRRYALIRMNDYYKLFALDTSVNGYRIRVFYRQLHSKQNWPPRK